MTAVIKTSKTTVPIKKLKLKHQNPNIASNNVS